jgi:hypothetical protein
MVFPLVALIIVRATIHWTLQVLWLSITHFREGTIGLIFQVRKLKLAEMSCLGLHSSPRFWDQNLKAPSETPLYSSRQDKVSRDFNHVPSLHFLELWESCPFSSNSFHQSAMSTVDISAMSVFFQQRPGCPWRACLSPWDNWFGIQLPLLIITRGWATRNMALILEDWLWAKSHCWRFWLFDV